MRRSSHNRGSLPAPNVGKSQIWAKMRRLIEWRRLAVISVHWAASRPAGGEIGQKRQRTRQIDTFQVGQQ